jgi:hypothetical protein
VIDVPSRESIVQQLATLEGVVPELTADCVDDLVAADVETRRGNWAQAELHLERARFSIGKIVELPQRLSQEIRQRIHAARTK